MSKKNGKCKWFNAAKGFGFIEGEDGVDYYVHFSGIQSEGYKSLGDGEAVVFNIEADANGKTRAVNVTGPGGAPVQGTQRGSKGRGKGKGGGGGKGGGVCYAWQEGRCDRGDACRFKHE